MSDQVKISHSLRLLSRFESMKERELVCDFTIKVGNKSFSVHRAVLVASSDYFEGMFSSNMKEVREGCVEMKNLGVNAIEQAIEFMYTGSAKITMESVQDILHVAELFQLDGLKNLCFQFLLDNLSAQNCLSVINLAQTYNLQDVKEEASQIVVTNIEAVISSEMFPMISRSDLLRYIANVGYETSWNAAITWAKDKDEFPQLLEGMALNKFPPKFLLEEVLEEPLVQKLESTKELVVRALFSDSKRLKEMLDSSNCFHLNFLAEEHGIGGEIDDAISQYMANNFEEIVTQAQFCDVDKGLIIDLFQCSETKCTSQTVKWDAVLKWVKYNLQNRKKFFPELFNLIKLEDMSLEFLKDIVREENLVEESRKCSKKLMDIVFEKAMALKCEVCKTQQMQEQASDDEEGAVGNTETYQQPYGGKMSHRILGTSLPFSRWNTIEITYSFDDGEFRGIFYDARQFKAYLPNSWLGQKYRLRLKKAFGDRQIFKLEYRSLEPYGAIIWGDIPHKTSMTGGTKNNGYPDDGYLDRLDFALEAKGF